MTSNPEPERPRPDRNPETGPSQRAVSRGWADRDAAYSPRYYAYHGPDVRSEQLEAALTRHVDADSSVLEVGCSAGRHLKQLHEAGFRDLHGLDVNADSFDVMAETYPDLAGAATHHDAAIEDAVEEFEDGRFDAVVSVETLQHLHPEADWVFGALARVAEDLLVTVECESPVSGPPDRPAEGDTPASSTVDGGLPLYFRSWGDIFTGHGMEAVEERSVGRDTLRVFRHPD